MHDNATISVSLTGTDADNQAPAWPVSAASIEFGRFCDVVPAGFCVVDHRHRYLWVNRRFSTLTKHTAESHVGETIYDVGPVCAASMHRAVSLVTSSQAPATIFDPDPASGLRASSIGRWMVHAYPIKLEDGSAGVACVIAEPGDVQRPDQAPHEPDAGSEPQPMRAIGYWDWDITRNRLYWSDEIYRILGFQPQRCDASYDTLIERVHAEDRDRVTAALNSALHDNMPFDIEHRIVMPGGGIRIVHELGEVSFNEAGKPVRMLGMVHDITPRKTAEERLANSERELRAILHNMKDTFYRTDQDGLLILVSRSIQSLLGYAAEEVSGLSFGDLCADRIEYEKFFRSLELHAGRLHDFELQLVRKDGSLIWSSVNADYIHNEAGLLCGVEGTIRDISERKRSESQLHKLAQTLEQSDDAAIITDPDGTIEYVNPAFEKLTGYTREEVLGAKPSIIRSGKQRPSSYKKLWKTILAGRVFSDILVNRKKDGTIFYEEKTITPLKNDRGNITHFVATGKDVTERVQTEARLQHLAHHDALTALPNRALFMDRLGQALARAELHGRLLAIMFVDLDRFKKINDTFGHDTGDRVLKELASRLHGCIRAEDTVARLGGDEFAILLDDLTSIDDATPLARKILDALAPATTLDGRELFVTASIGISLYPADGKDSHALLKNADTAMYRAKELGKNNYQFYSTDMSARAFERRTVENSLQHALEREQFLLFYQPQVDMRSGMIVGAEALLRWQHPELGIVAPGDFVPLLEETGQIVEVGQWVLETACMQARAWHNEGYPDLRVSVNLSGRQFNDPTFIDSIERIVRETTLDPSRLELEITESVIMRNARTTVNALNSLGQMGVRLSIDDFGTGYSSLSYLKRFPIDSLKIDRSFIRDVTTSSDDAAIAHAIIALGQSLKLDVIAEGVESRQQFEFLKTNGCNAIQGYLVSQPLPVDSMRSLLRETPNYFQ